MKNIKLYKNNKLRNELKKVILNEDLIESLISESAISNAIVKQISLLGKFKDIKALQGIVGPLANAAKSSLNIGKALKILAKDTTEKGQALAQSMSVIDNVLDKDFAKINSNLIKTVKGEAKNLAEKKIDPKLLFGLFMAVLTSKALAAFEAPDVAEAGGEQGGSENQQPIEKLKKGDEFTITGLTEDMKDGDLDYAGKEYKFDYNAAKKRMTIEIKDDIIVLQVVDEKSGKLKVITNSMTG